MSYQIESLFILRYFIDRADVLAKLMGSLGAVFLRNLLRTVDQLDDYGATIDLQSAVDNLLDLALKSPARQVAIEARNEAARAKEDDDPARSIDIDDLPLRDGTSLDCRSANVGAEPSTGGSAGDPVKDLIKEITLSRSSLNEAALRSERTARAAAAKPPETERRISAWISDRPGPSHGPLKAGEACTLSFKVGNPVKQSLIAGPGAAVPSADIPDAGLGTEWVVTSSTVELAALSPDTVTESIRADGSVMWSARFPLHIPKEGESRVIDLGITPQSGAGAQLDVIIYARREIYRQFKVELDVAGKRGAIPASEAAAIVDDLVHVRAADLDIDTTHEWTTPPGELLVTVFGTMTHVMGDAGSENVNLFTPWSGVEAMVAGPILNVRTAAEKFRGVWENYLNRIDPADLQARLKNFNPQYDWAHLNYYNDGDHEQLWDKVSSGPELWDLAAEGYNLYNSFFPAGSDLRRCLDKMTPGEKLSITWLPTSGSGWISHVPWGLMYASPVAPGTPVDPLLFLGLRYRIGYTAYQVQAASKALGGLNQVGGANLLYWGNSAGDATGVEARWQEQQFSTWANQIFAPSSASTDRKADLLNMLSAPPASRVGVLYFFCQCSVGDGNAPVLRFGNTIQRSDIIRHTELGGGALSDRPLVFANACTTLSADPYLANELEKAFFNRGCRAYIGTESKVPIQLASRFAYTFFSFFYRRVDPEPMAAGEAISQARLFLWTQFKNIGGLFYSYVNQYDVFMAEESEVHALRL
ncbi:MAG TPA: CHAT domain-containing protein [Blastocatellia bacterium]|nr:CHAT domain-containing protein [Blastocatellia bacterium]